MFRLVLLALLLFALTHCQQGDPKTGIYAQRITTQGGSCPELVAKPRVVMGIQDDMLHFITPRPGGGGVFVEVPSSGGVASVCDENLTYDVQVAELSTQKIRLSTTIRWDAKGSNACPTLPADPSLSCEQAVELEYVFVESCDSPCGVVEYVGTDGRQELMACRCQH